jgi:hypothetical protein
MSGVCSTHGRDKKCIQTTLEKYNIKVDLKHYSLGMVKWVQMAQNRGQ